MNKLTPNPKELLTIAQAAEYVCSSPSTIKRRIRDGKLPAVRNGRKLYVEASDLNALFTPACPSEEDLVEALARQIACSAPNLSPESRTRLASLLA